MKVYIASSHKEAENRQQIEDLCAAVHEAKLVDFSFIRDVQHYKETIRDPKELWGKVYDEIGACDALLIDVSGHPTSGRLVEVGIAYALRKPVIIVERVGTHHKELFYGVSSAIIKYKDMKDLTRQLKKYATDSSFNVTDQMTMLLMFLMVGGVIGYFLAQFWIPLGVIGALVYWLVLRKFFVPIRNYDRLVIFIPLIAVWAGTFYLLRPGYLVLSLAWLIIFWPVALYLLKKFKLSL